MESIHQFSTGFPINLAKCLDDPLPLVTQPTIQSSAHQNQLKSIVYFVEIPAKEKEREKEKEGEIETRPEMTGRKRRGSKTVKNVFFFNGNSAPDPSHTTKTQKGKKSNQNKEIFQKIPARRGKKNPRTDDSSYRTSLVQRCRL